MQPAARCGAMSPLEWLNQTQPAAAGQTSTVSLGARAFGEDFENEERPTGVEPAVAATPPAAALTAPAFASDTSSACARCSSSSSEAIQHNLLGIRRQAQVGGVYEFCASNGIPWRPDVVMTCEFMRTIQKSAKAPAVVPHQDVVRQSHPEPTHPMPQRPPPP